jgi:DNA-binding SARP family transcriptional activator
MEALWPEAIYRKAAERLSTETANLRRVVREGLGDPKAQAVINSGGHYRLNPAVLDIDVWRFEDHLAAATAATDAQQQVAELRAAIEIRAGAEFAAGRDYDWITGARDKLRRRGIRARLALADLTAAADPQQAARIVVEAADLDVYNEDLAQRAIRALAALGDHDGIRTRLRILRNALDEIGHEPSADTLALTAHLMGGRRELPTSGHDLSLPEMPGDSER